MCIAQVNLHFPVVHLPVFHDVFYNECTVYNISLNRPPTAESAESLCGGKVPYPMIGTAFSAQCTVPSPINKRCLQDQAAKVC